MSRDVRNKEDSKMRRQFLSDYVRYWKTETWIKQDKNKPLSREFLRKPYGLAVKDNKARE